MNSKCYCTGWPLMAGLAASVLALPSFAAALTLDEGCGWLKTMHRR